MVLQVSRTIFPILILLSTCCLSQGLTIGQHVLQNGTYDLHVFAPETTASYPVIFFVGGVGGDAPVPLYSELLSLVVVRGYIAVGFDHLALPNYPKHGREFLRLLEWASGGGLAAAMAAQNLTAVPDVGRAAVMGQSAGNHVIGEALQVILRVGFTIVGC